MRIRIRIRSDPVIFGPLDPDPDPVLFSTDPDPDPTCNNGFIKLFLSWTTYKSESTNSSIKWWVIISNFIPTYLKYKYIFVFISISGGIRIFLFSWAGSGSVEKNVESSILENIYSRRSPNYILPIWNEFVCVRSICSNLLPIGNLVHVDMTKLP